jgi:UDP-N-acetyl-D-glucosamine dehydrogenase
MSKNKTIGVIGLGYVGLPLAVVFAEAGYNVIGFEIDQHLCDNLNNGISHIKDIENERLVSIINNKLFTSTTDFAKLKNCNCISICVPTPLNKIKDPDLSFVIKATESISNFLNASQLIILESTTYPGTTKDVVLPILEKSGLKVGKDFYLCFSPERVDPGNKKWHTKNTPKILGGITEKCTEIGNIYYGDIFDTIILVKNTEAAELVKIYENTFRLINIALVNELSQICDTLKLDVWEIIDAASTKPFGFMKFLPGPGLGGHCIPLDPHYLAWKMRTLEFKTRMIDLASEINSSMPTYVVNKIGDKLNTINLPFKDAKILILGIAYKKDIDDLRESPALKIIELLQNRGGNVKYHDKYCPVIKDDGHTKIDKLPMYSIDINKEIIKTFDIAIIVTDHSNVDYNMIANNCIIVDTRGVIKK